MVLVPHLAGLAVERVSASGRSVHVLARTCASGAACTGCGVVSRRVHSSYQRQLADTAAGGQEMLIDLQARRFFCGSPACAKATFAEQVPSLTTRYGRRTSHLQAVLQAVALALGGRADDAADRQRVEEPSEPAEVGGGLPRCRRSGLRAVRMMSAPLARASRAVSSPMPELPPITTTVCPSRPRPAGPARVVLVVSGITLARRRRHRTRETPWGGPWVCGVPRARPRMYALLIPVTSGRWAR